MSPTGPVQTSWDVGSGREEVVEKAKQQRGMSKAERYRQREYLLDELCALRNGERAQTGADQAEAIRDLERQVLELCQQPAA